MQQTSKAASAISNTIEINFNNYREFIKYPMLNYVQLMKKEKIIDEIPNLIEHANRYDVSFKHPIFIGSLALLLGNNIAKNIIKPREIYKEDHYILDKNSYNACSDLLVISRIELIRKKFYEIFKIAKINVEFVSNDENLKQFISWFDFIAEFEYKPSSSFPNDLDINTLIESPEKFIENMRHSPK